MLDGNVGQACRIGDRGWSSLLSRIEWLARLTVQEGEGGQAGEGGHVQFHLLQADGEFQDPVQPVSEGGAHLIPEVHRRGGSFRLLVNKLKKNLCCEILFENGCLCIF
jgi:hypothetical protein